MDEKTFYEDEENTDFSYAQELENYRNYALKSTTKENLGRMYMLSPKEAERYQC